MSEKIHIVQESTNPLILSCVPSETDANVNGFVHGGVLFYLCDETVGRYVTLLGRKGAAADGNIHYYRPALIGQKLIAAISERKVGKRLGTFLVELKDESGALIADALFTVAFQEEEK